MHFIPNVKLYGKLNNKEFRVFRFQQCLRYTCIKEKNINKTEHFVIDIFDVFDQVHNYKKFFLHIFFLYDFQIFLLVFV